MSALLNVSGLERFRFEGREVRTIMIAGEPHFVGKDVAEALGYADPTTAMRSHCRGVQKLHPITDALGRVQEARILAEPDVLRLIVGSTLPEAQRFEAWVFEEVLPSIRKTGRYVAHDSSSEIAQAIYHELIAARKDIARLTSNVVQFSVEQLKRRRNPTKATREVLLLAFKERGNRCPCCEYVVDIADVQVDHFMGNQYPDRKHCWPVCRRCHGELTSSRRDRTATAPLFHGFQTWCRAREWFNPQRSLFA